jgi:hypothetical protein
MRPKQRQATGSRDLFRARLDQIINVKHEPVQLAGKLDWAWIDGPTAFTHSPGPAKFQMEALPVNNRHRHAAS